MFPQSFFISLYKFLEIFFEKLAIFLHYVGSNQWTLKDTWENFYMAIIIFLQTFLFQLQEIFLHLALISIGLHCDIQGNM